MLAMRLRSFARRSWLASNGRQQLSSLSGSGGDDKNPRREVTSGKDDDYVDDAEKALFSPENIKNLSPTEVARMRVVYSYVKEHAEIVEKMKPPVDPVMNPLIDPRSFNLQTLPKVPTEALQQFREDVPPEEASAARALSTRAAWDTPNKDPKSKAAVKNEMQDLIGSEEQNDLWTAVDERTMDPFYYMRMRRQSMRGSAAAALVHNGPQRSGTLGNPQRRCRLTGPRGRVYVDFREVGTLREFLNDHGKIVPRRRTALSAKAQRKVARAVKTARQMALLHPEPRPGMTLEEMRELEKQMMAGGQ